MKTRYFPGLQGALQSSCLLVGSITLMLGFSAAQAATLTWDSDTVTTGAQDGGGTWSAGGLTFWNGTADVATTNDLLTDIAQFGTGGTLASAATVNVGTQSINGLIFGATTTNGYILTNSGASILTLGGSGIVLNTGAQATTVGSANLALTLGATQAWTNNSANTLTIGSAITGAGKLLSFGGTGTIQLNGSLNNVSTNSGVNTGATLISSGGANLTVVFINSGTMTINGGNFSDSGQFTVSAGTLNVSTGGTLTQIGGVTKGLQFSNTGTSLINLKGGTIDASSAGYIRFGHLAGKSTLNLNSGEFDTGVFFSHDSATSGNVVNFAGATVKLFASLTDLIDPARATRFTLNNVGGGGGAVIDTNGNSLGIAEVINHTGTGTDGGLTKLGAGTLTLSAANTYTGATAVSAVTLLVNNTAGSGTGTGAVTVNSGTLGGTGAISGPVTVNVSGVLSPGASIATLATGAVILNNGSTFTYELNTTAGTGDLLNAFGNLGLNDIVTLNLADLGSGTVLGAGTKFTLISYSGTLAPGSVFNGYADGSTFSAFNNQFKINYNDTPLGSVNGGAFANAVTLTAVPEPRAALLGILGLAAILRRRR